jgi:FkbM family methyltransferase
MNINQKIKEYIRELPWAYNISRKVYLFFFPTALTPIQKQIKRTFRKKSSVFFVQVGAADGVKSDPIHDLIITDRRWTGIFIEPVGFVFQRLKRNYRNADRFIFENVAIATRRGKKKFYYVSEEAEAELGDDLRYRYDLVGSFDKDHVLEHFQHFHGDIEPYIIEEEINCVPLQEILDSNHVETLDLLVVDTEGFDYVVLSQVNFNKYNPLAIVYEHKHLSVHERKKAKALLKASGYNLVEYGIDTLALSED